MVMLWYESTRIDPGEHSLAVRFSAGERLEPFTDTTVPPLVEEVAATQAALYEMREDRCRPALDRLSGS